LFYLALVTGIMRISKYFASLLLISAFASGQFAWSQDRIDSLRSILDAKGIPDSVYVKASVEFCEASIKGEEKYLIPEYALKGLEADSLNRDIESKIKLYECLGNYYWQVGKLNESASQFDHMRLLGESRSDSLIMAKSFNGLGTVYYLMNNYDKALEYYQKGLSFSGTDSLLIVRIYNNIANTFTQTGELDSVLPYYNKSRDYHLAHKNYRYLSNVYTNIALVYEKLGKIRESQNYLVLALDAAKEANDPYQITTVYQVSGDLAARENPEKAIKLYNLALDLAQKGQSFNQILLALNNLAYLYQDAGNFREAFSCLRKVKDLDDSLDLADKKSRIRLLESEHLISLRNSVQEKRDRDQEHKLMHEEQRQRQLNTVLIIGFITAMLLLAMGVYFYFLRIRINQTKEKFFSMIAHDIRNPFSGILGISGLLNDDADKHGDPVQGKLIRTLHKSLNQVYELLENLLQWSQAESGKIAFDPKVQTLSPFVHEVICLHTATGKQKGIRIENQVQSGLTARFDSNMFQTVLRNLLSNALKFSKKNSTIFISAEVNRKEVVVKVRDQGTGMTPEQVHLIFKTDKNISTPGTRNETGTGLGLSICKNFIARHGGTIWAESKPDEGVTISFTLPDHPRKG